MKTKIVFFIENNLFPVTSTNIETQLISLNSFNNTVNLKAPLDWTISNLNAFMFECNNLIVEFSPHIFIFTLSVQKYLFSDFVSKLIQMCKTNNVIVCFYVDNKLEHLPPRFTVPPQGIDFWICSTDSVCQSVQSELKIQPRKVANFNLSLLSIPTINEYKTTPKKDFKFLVAPNPNTPLVVNLIRSFFFSWHQYFRFLEQKVIFELITNDAQIVAIQKQIQEMVTHPGFHSCFRFRISSSIPKDIKESDVFINLGQHYEAFANSLYAIYNKIPVLAPPHVSTENYLLHNMVVPFVNQLKFSKHVPLAVFKSPSVITIKNPIDNSDLLWFENTFTNSNFPGPNYSQQDKKRALNVILRRGVGVLDTGAHIGDFGICLAKCLMNLGRSDIKVYCIDPCPRKCDFMKKMKTLNQITNLSIICNGLCDKHGKKFKKILCAGERINNTGSWNYVEDEEGENTFTSLDHLFSTGKIGKIGFFWLDAEGSELQILQGAKKLLSTCKPVIWMENAVRERVEKSNNGAEVAIQKFRNPLELKNDQQFASLFQELGIKIDEQSSRSINVCLYFENNDFSPQAHVNLTFPQRDGNLVKILISKTNSNHEVENIVSLCDFVNNIYAVYDWNDASDYTRYLYVVDTLSKSKDIFFFGPDLQCFDQKEKNIFDVEKFGEIIYESFVFHTDNLLEVEKSQDRLAEVYKTQQKKYNEWLLKLCKVPSSSKKNHKKKRKKKKFSKVVV